VLDFPGATAAVEAAGHNDAEKLGAAGLIAPEGHVNTGSQATSGGNGGNQPIGDPQQQGALQQGLERHKGAII